MKIVYMAVIPLEPITKKNHQQILRNPRTGRPFIVPSAQYKRYEAQALAVLPRLDKPIDSQVCVECKFYKSTLRSSDLPNHLQAILDILVYAGILKDDNYKIVVSTDGSRVLHDKENPRTEVTIYEY